MPPTKVIIRKSALVGEYFIDGKPVSHVTQGQVCEMDSEYARQAIERGLVDPIEVPKISYKVTIFEPAKRALAIETKEADRPKYFDNVAPVERVFPDPRPRTPPYSASGSTEPSQPSLESSSNYWLAKSQSPLVTAICVTRNRPQWIQKAVRCFQAQTYPNCELLIIADGEDIQCKVTESLADGAPVSHRVRYVYLGEERLTIGTKRNLACERAEGEIICHWDDDDWSHSRRIAAQVRSLEATGKMVTGYYHMVFIDPDGRRYQFSGSPWNVCGSSLAYRREWWAGHRFPARDVQEDAAFSNAAYAAGVLLPQVSDGLMEASIHPGNTSPRNLALDMFTPL